MRFNHTRCRLCGAYIFEINDLIAYGMSNTGLFRIDLKGEQPWTGVHCVCKTCAQTVARMAGSS